MNNKTFIIVIAILIIVSIIGFKAYMPARFDIASRIKVSDFPMEIGEWKAEEIQLSERDYEILETRNLFVRDYKNQAGDSVVLYVIYSEDNRKVSHPPEICLTGGGLTIINKKPIQLTNTIKANKLTMEKKDFLELVAYWYKAGGFYTDSYLKQQLKVVTSRILGRRTAGAMIRLTTVIKEGKEDAALALLKKFGSQVEPLLAKYVP